DLTLYDGATRLAARTLLATNDAAHPRFELRADVEPNHLYRWELTHAGGADGSVGWVAHSTSDVYAGGSASVGGVTQPFDFYFRLRSRALHARQAGARQHARRPLTRR